MSKIKLEFKDPPLPQKKRALNESTELQLGSKWFDMKTTKIKYDGMKLVLLKIKIKISNNFKVSCKTHGVVLHNNRSSLSWKIKVEWILCGRF